MDESSGYSFVSQTDGIIFYYSNKVIKRLKLVNYTKNIYGWGIDWIAICFSYINNLFVIRDNLLTIKHDPGTGYSTDEANTQMEIFISTNMSPQELIMYLLLNSYSSLTTASYRK